MTSDRLHTQQPSYARPVRLRTRVFGVIGMLLGAFMIVSSFVRGGPIVTAIVGAIFMLIAGYWVFARNKPSSLAAASERLQAARDRLERERRGE